MKHMRLAGVAVVCVTFVVGGCGKKAPRTTPPAPQTIDDGTPAPPPPPPPPADAGPAAAPTEEEIFARKSLDELNAERPLGDAYFEIDQSSIRDEARSVLQKNADWLRRWTSTRITVEGHCDARGTSEYNLALGERRGAAVKEYLVSLGIASERIAVISKGEESPVCTEDGESCWQQNRRGHFIITAK